ncbi:MAG: response regulator transcription factor [Clostridiales bacterium]|jgi:DNA-binding response OmpR family regulator|nr:response regulator transcription factor [Clostridiales bacterium]
MKDKILVVDDEKEIAELVRDYLEAAGYQVILAFDGQEAIESWNEHKPDMAILDIMLPKIDGMEVCKSIREESDIPILMLSAKKSEEDKIRGLGLGADDYITKPFSPKEMVARVQAHFRRYYQLSQTADKKDRLDFKDLIIDISSHSVKVRGKEVFLSAKEFEVLKFFAMNPNKVLTRDEIFDHVWGYQGYGDINTVAVHVRKLREKLEEDPSNPVYIQTIWGVGYKFVGE